MNELSKRVLNKLSNMRNFEKNIPRRGMTSETNPLDLKLFFIFDIASEKAN